MPQEKESIGHGPPIWGTSGVARGSSGDMHVAIVGAGIGGLALAMRLYKKGVPFTVYEAASEYSTMGAGIGFGPNWDLALDMIEEGFRPKFDRVCIGNKPESKNCIYYEGVILQEGLESWYSNSSCGHPDYVRRAGHRNAVLQLMTSFIPIETVQFNKRLTGTMQHPDKVVLSFADGSTSQTSILIGADGIKSVPIYAGSYCCRGVIPTSEAEGIFEDLTDVAHMYLGDKRCCVTYLISGGKESNFLLCISDREPWETPKAVT
ncbi:hypothetical protein BDV19DRAFT_384105 [Aspergillus venezuelensis]